MIRLAILRHAKSSWEDPAARDFDRPLNARGRAAAARMGRELRQRHFRFDIVLASPAMRVRQTLDRLGEGYGALPEVRFEDALYAATERTLLALIKALPGEVQAALLVGHNPGLHSLVLNLARDDGQGQRERIEGKFPTAAFVAIDFSIDRWSEIERGAGQLREIILPRELID